MKPHQRAVFVSKRMFFEQTNASFIDMVLAHMAQDIDVALKIKAGMPVKHGVMKSATRHFKSLGGGYRVEIDVGYAAYQERGRRADGTHIVKNYTTAGTSSGFFRRAIDMVVSKRDNYIQEARRALNL